MATKTKQKENEAIKSHSSIRAPDESMPSLNGKRYKCEHCDFITKWKKALDSHTLIIHSNP